MNFTELVLNWLTDPINIIIAFAFFGLASLIICFLVDLVSDATDIEDEEI